MDRLIAGLSVTLPASTSSAEESLHDLRGNACNHQTHAPLQQDQIGLDGGQRDLQILAGDQFVLRLSNSSHHSLGLRLVEPEHTSLSLSLRASMVIVAIGSL